MSRSGYSDDCENYGLWRGTVAAAIRGKRGQAFLKELAAAMDAMPDKRLTAGFMRADGCLCTLGVIADARGMDLSPWEDIDPYDFDYKKIANDLGIAAPMAQEIMFMNDEAYDWELHHSPDADARRWELMRRLIDKRIVAEKSDVAGEEVANNNIGSGAA